ncbi:MAG TPA: autotransporter-associated beta strand repeat-containing protein [Tepidisphaeraceae bacterium]|nr:autotransporter-associated beta strand repeat-containing protein [Tepidisphaeraceae bacterium]
MLSLAHAAGAATLYWDADGNGANAGYGGSGTWDSATANWNTSAVVGDGSLQTWNSAADPLNDASFLRGTDATVAVNGTQILKSISFGASTGSFTTGSGTYNLSGDILDIRQTSFSNGINNLNGAVTTIGGETRLFGGLTSSGNSTQRMNIASGDLTFGNLQDASGVGGTHTLSLETYGTSNLTFNGNITKTAGSSGITLQVGGSGTSNNATIRLGGNNSGLTGTTTFTRGTLVLNHNSVLAGASSLTVSNANSTVANADSAKVLIGTAGVSVNKSISFSSLTATDTSDVRVIGGANTTGTATYQGSITLGAFAPSGNGSRLEVTAAEGGTVAFTNTINDGSNSVPIFKTGAGTVVFSRPNGNTYDGGTTVAAGTLLVNNTDGSGTGTGLTVVNTGATLGGTGSVAALSTSGTLAPGSGSSTTATLSAAGNVNFNSGSTFAIEIAGDGIGSYDQLRLTNTANADVVTLSGGPMLSVDLIDTSWLTPLVSQTFVIIDNAGTNAQAYWGSYFTLADSTTLTDGSTFSVEGTTFQINYGVDGSGLGGVGNDVTLTTVVTAVPEPASLGVAAVAGLAVLARRRRR